MHNTRLSAYGSVEEEEKATHYYAADAAKIFADIQRVLGMEGASLDSFEQYELKSISNWDTEFGLGFRHILYFHLGG